MILVCIKKVIKIVYKVSFLTHSTNVAAATF